MTIQDQYDPHAPKISPDDPRLQLGQSKGRALKKGYIRALVIILFLAVIGAFIMALIRSTQTIEERQGEKKAKQEEVQIQRIDTVPPEVNRLENLEITLPSDPQDEVEKKKPTIIHGAKDKQASLSFVDSRTKELEEMRLEEERRAMGAGLEAGGSEFNSFSLNQTERPDPKQQLVDRYKEAMAQIQDGASESASFSGLDLGSMGEADPNMQGRKNQFLNDVRESKDYISSGLNTPISRYEVKASTIIPVSLITGINSDLPGEIVGQVRENVYDTVSGNHLLIPQGTRVMAKYDSMIAYGQERILVCWDRLIRPDGSSVRLECAPGTDLAGYAGFEDDVNHHYGRLIGGVVLSSLLSVGASTSQGTSLGDNTDMQEVFALNVGQNINNVGQQITRRILSTQPTITIRPGYSVNILVNKDMVITPYELD